MKCNVSACEKICPLSELVKHLKRHIHNGLSISCPVVRCCRIMANKSTFASHVSVKRGKLTKLNVNTSIIHEEPSVSCTDVMESNNCDNFFDTSALTP